MEPLERDGTVLTDVINTLRCLQVLGFSNTTKIASDAAQTLIILSNSTSSNYTVLSPIVNHCHSKFAFNTAFTHSFFAEIPQDIRVYTTLDEALNNPDLLPDFGTTHTDYDLLSKFNYSSIIDGINKRDDKNYYFMFMATNNACVDVHYIH